MSHASKGQAVFEGNFPESSKTTGVFGEGGFHNQSDLTSGTSPRPKKKQQKPPNCSSFDASQEREGAPPNATPWRRNSRPFLEGLFNNRCPSPELVGGFNPFEKYESNWKSSPNRGENIWNHQPVKFPWMKTSRVFFPKKNNNMVRKIALPQDPRLQQWLDDNPTFDQLISNLPRASRHPGGNENTRKISGKRSFGAMWLMVVY